MAIAFVQSLLQGSSKTTGTTLVLSGSKTLTLGNTVFVGFGSPDDSGTYSVADNLGNTYVLSGSAGISTLTVAARLYRCDVDHAGTLTSITITHPSTTPRAAIAVEFSGCDTTIGTATYTTASSRQDTDMYPGGTDSTFNTADTVVGNLWIGVATWKGPVGDTFAVTTFGAAPVAALEPTAEQGTTGGSAGSNSSVGLLYYIAPTVTTVRYLSGTSGVSRAQAAAGAEIQSAAAAPTLLVRKPRLGPNYRR